jgi:hypothetical protein
MVLVCDRVCSLDLKVGEDRLDAGVPLPRTWPVIAIRRRFREQALQASDPAGGDRQIEFRQPFSDAFVQRRPRRDRGELDDAAAVTVLALVAGVPKNSAGEALT